MSGERILVIGRAELIGSLGLDEGSCRRESNVSTASKLLAEARLVFLEEDGSPETETLLERCDETSALVYVLTGQYSLARGQHLLFNRRQVVGYLDVKRLSDPRVRQEISGLVVQVTGQREAGSAHPLGWAVGHVDREDYEQRRLVSLFIGGMREFVVGLKFLLLDLVDHWNRFEDRHRLTPADRDLPYARQLDDWHLWEVQKHKPDREARRHLVEFSRRRAAGEYRLFSGMPAAERSGVIERPPIILIRGESGTGKSLFARLVHDTARPGWPFVDVLCTGLPERLVEIELFGALAGAYTDRKTTHEGLIISAYGGVLFLDEIGDMALGLQSKLLKFLDDSLVHPVGWVGPGIFVPVTIVAATNRDLGRAVREGQFRVDLWYRLRQQEIVIPPLRERMWDLDRMVDFVLQNPARNPGVVTHVEAAVLRALGNHEFKGHFREVEGVLFRALQRARLVGEKVLRLEHLPPEVHVSAGEALPHRVPDET